MSPVAIRITKKADERDCLQDPSAVPGAFPVLSGGLVEGGGGRDGGPSGTTSRSFQVRDLDPEPPGWERGPGRRAQSSGPGLRYHPRL